MGLQVWLPLDGNLNNLGASKNIFSGSATFTDNGKTGKCLTSETVSSNTSLPTTLMSSTKYSMCSWINTNLGGKWIWYMGGGNGTTRGLWIKGDGTITFAYSGSDAFTSDITVNSNVWHHICLTCDGTNGKMYIDGVYHKGSNSIRVDSAGTNDIFLHGENCSLCDFRIYDHCLSAQEVKKIAQGLVIHYPFDNRGFGKENLLQYDTSFYTFPLGTTTYFTNQMNNNSVCEIVNNSKRGKCLHLYSHHTGDLNNSRVYKTFSGKANKKYIYTYDFMSTSTLEETGRIELNGGNYSWSMIFSEQYLEVSKWKRMKIQTPVLTSDTTIYMFFYCKPETHCYFKNIKLQEGDTPTPWTPNSLDSQYTALGLNNTRIADISGFGNNGIRNNITYDYLTKVKYGKSAIFNGNDSVITLGDISNLLQNEFTINLWFCKKDLGTKNYETLFGGPSGFEMDTRAGSGTTLQLYMASNRGTLFIPFNFSNWYMVTMVCDNINQYYYINGNLVSTITKKGMPSGNYFIGAWQDASKQNYKGNMSDFRLYTTALSADDIKELYNYNNPIVIIEEEGQDVGQEPLV